MEEGSFRALDERNHNNPRIKPTRSVSFHGTPTGSSRSKTTTGGDGVRAPLLIPPRAKQSTGAKSSGTRLPISSTAERDDANGSESRNGRQEAREVEIELQTRNPSAQGRGNSHGVIRRIPSMIKNGKIQTLDLDVEYLDLSRTACLEKETKLMANALVSGQLKNLKYLVLEGNNGDLGVRSFLKALEMGHLQKLEKLICWQVSSYDQITTSEQGTKRIAKSIEECKLSSLKMFDFKGSLPKLVPPSGYLKGILNSWCGKGNGCCSLSSWSRCVFLCLCNGMGDCRCCIPDVLTGDDGLVLLVDAFKKCELEKQLTILYLEDNYLSDKGAKKLARFMGKGGLPYLEELDLHGNDIGREGAEAIVNAFLENPLLTADVKMDWPDHLLQTEAEAFRECNIRLEHKLQNDLRGRVRRDQIVVGPRQPLKYRLEPDESLPHPASDSWLRRFRRPKRLKLYLHCQGEHCWFPTKEEIDSRKGSLMGIRIVKRAFWGTSSKNRVDRSSGVHITYISGDLLKNVLEKQQESRHHGTESSTSTVTGKHDQETAMILKELLMLAERKPDDFFMMFGLRRVLVKDTEGMIPDKYCARWMCNACVMLKGESVIPLTEDCQLIPSR